MGPSRAVAARRALGARVAIFVAFLAAVVAPAAVVPSGAGAANPMVPLVLKAPAFTPTTVGTTKSEEYFSSETWSAGSMQQLTTSFEMTHCDET